MWRLAALALLLATAACVARPDGTEVVEISTRTYGFVDELLSGAPGTPQQVEAVLVLPETGTAPFPALVLLHTSNGQGAQDWLYAQRLREAGIAVLALDSFSGRGISHTVRDQTLVSTASMLADAYAGLHYLSSHPRVDPRRIGVLGFSKGGIAALYAAYRAVQESVASPGEAFALHVAYYPWCGLRLHRPVTTGAPVLIQTGALDDLVPPERCADLITQSRGPDGPNRMRLVVHAGARHAFDHPMLAWFGNLPISAPSPASCALQQQADGRFVETHSGTVVDVRNLREALAPCSRMGHAGGNEEAAEAAYAETLKLLKKAGFLGP